MERCPNKYSPSVTDGYTCVLVSEDVVPFVFLFLCLIACMIVGIAKIIKPELHYKNTTIGIISSICVLNWFFMIYLTIKDKMW